ncbi:MAG: nucleotide sugar dehydrogenase [Acidimicrobiales bacterium]
MNIAIFGLGYVGTVTAACFSGLGHHVIGVDTSPEKVAKFNAGTSPVLEPGVPELLAAGLESGRLRATTDPAEAVHNSDISLVAVGTPSRANGDIDLTYIERVAADIGSALRTSHRDGQHVLVIRSTVLPGTADIAGNILAETSGRTLGDGCGVAVNPEFLREGQGVADFMEPPLIMVGADDETTAKLVMSLYDGIEAERIVEPVRLAEMVKYANNSWHAAKVTYANEIGVVAQSLGIDGARVMEILCSDTKLNISAAYMRPGFAFGGSCLPKDVRALNHAAKAADVSVPLLSSLLVSNSIHVQRVIDCLIEWHPDRIGFTGLAFKAGTDDLRESPIVEVVERMLGKGFDCVIHDAEVNAPDLIGGNRAYIEAEIPHLNRLLLDELVELVADSDVLVVAKSSPELVELIRANPQKPVLDLVRLPEDVRSRDNYMGVAW